MSEDGAVLDRVVHHLLLPVAVAHELTVGIHLLPGPLLPPCGVAVLVDGIHLAEEHALGVGDVVEHGVLVDEVAHHDEAATTHVQGSEECRLHPVGQLPHSLLVLAKLIIVEVVDDDVVGACLTVTEATGTLSSAAAEELHAARRLELAVGPVAPGRLLLPEVTYQSVVVLQLRLHVGQQSLGGILALAHHDHEVDEPLRLKHEPQGQEHVHVGALGMATWPHEHRLQVGGGAHLARRLVVEGGVVDGLQHLARGLVLELQVMGEVVLAEGGVVLLQSPDACLLLRLALGAHDAGVGHGVYLLAELPPLLVGFPSLCTYCHRLNDK